MYEYSASLLKKRKLNILSFIITVLIHCIRYNYIMKGNLSAVLFMLLGFIYCSATDQTSSSSRGQKFALLGDSMTWIGGDSCEKATGWSHILKESGIADSIGMYARSGATWTNTSNTTKDTSFYSELLHDNNVVYNQAMRLIEDSKNHIFDNPDHIIIFAGANDSWFADHRPGIFDSNLTDKVFDEDTKPCSVTNLYCSVLLVCDLLKKYFPDSNLTIVTPLQMSKVSAEDIHNTSDIIDAAATSRGCRVVRADKEAGITHDVEYKSPTYTYDGVHTNMVGAKLVGDYILRNIKFANNHQN